MCPNQKHDSQFEKFHEGLKESVADYKGENHEIIKHVPAMFKLFTNLLGDPEVPSSCEPIIKGTIIYFKAPFDVIPEANYGPRGYLDDLYLCAWSLKKLKEQIGDEVLVKNWEGEGALDIVIDEIYIKTKGSISGNEKDILNYYQKHGLLWLYKEVFPN